MRLSDKQYQALVRIGILIVLVTVFAFERVPSRFQAVVLAIAALGAAVAFFPLATSRPFHSDKENDSCAAELKVRNCGEVIDVEHHESSTGMDVTLETLNSPARAEAGAYSQSLATNIQDVYSNLWQDLAASKGFLRLCNINRTVLDLGPSMIALSEAVEERFARVKEVHDLVNRLKGTPQTFSIELTSGNDIIVRCEGRSQVSMLLDEYEMQMRDLAKRADTSTTTIQ
ncbi:MAG: hypothetical protein ABSC48_19735 [Terracidiphilus sp.]|jgi:hypothetical protein